jgi:hypothetical protein
MIRRLFGLPFFLIGEVRFWIGEIIAGEVPP